MNELPEKKQPEWKKWLVPGEQTQPTPLIKEMIDGLAGTFEDKVMKLMQKVGALPRRGFDKNVFRKRTADQILSDGYITGCTDAALVFIACARAAGIPAKYIETVDLSWLQKGDGDMQGHIYSRVFDGDKTCWRFVDPMARKIDTSPDSDGRVIIAEGSDSWGIGVRDFDTLLGLVRESIHYHGPKV